MAALIVQINVALFHYNLLGDNSSFSAASVSCEILPYRNGMVKGLQCVQLIEGKCIPFHLSGRFTLNIFTMTQKLRDLVILLLLQHAALKTL